MTQVEFSQDNIMKCMCKMCPVQAESACAMGKNAKLMSAMQSGMAMMPGPDDVAGMYCSTGKASCTDLDQSKGCICPGCPVFAENGLTMSRYCENGSAAEIG